MKNLIIYTSNHGFTEKCVEILKEKLTTHTDAYNCLKIKTIDISSYDNIILGSPIYVHKISKKLSNFLNKNLDDLLKKNIYLFICSGNGERDYIKENFPMKIYEKSIMKKHFGAGMSIDNLNFMEKFGLKVLGKYKNYSNLNLENIQDMANHINSYKN